MKEMESCADINFVRNNHVVRASEDYFLEEEADVSEMWKVRTCWILGVYLMAV